MISRGWAPPPRALTRAAVLLVLALGVAACGTRAEPSPQGGGKLLTSASPSAEAEGTVDLRVYLRAGSAEQPYLQPVSRRTPITADLPRKALELLLAGPAPEDPPAVAAPLQAPLPPGTGIQQFQVQGATALVDLSAEAITRAELVEPTPAHEILAMAAVANTLTEFPEIDFVRLTVDGGGQAFWGGWGLPELLVRDEHVIGPPMEGDALPAPERFGTQEQRLGSADAGPVVIRGVRVKDRLGFVRVVVELGDASSELPASGVPVVSAMLDGERLVLEIDDVLSSSGDLAPGQRLALEHLPFDVLEAEPGELPGPARFAVPSGPRPFWLHTLTSPTRVVLDVRKCQQEACHE